MTLSHRIMTAAVAGLLAGGSLLGSAATAAPAATAVPAACQADFDLLTSLRADVTALQEELKTASTPQKADIVRQIRALNAQISVVDVRYQQCLQTSGA